MLKDIFGDKSWYKSYTGWGLAVFVAATAFLESACAAELLAAGTCATAQGWANSASAVLVTLGLRRAQN